MAASESGYVRRYSRQTYKSFKNDDTRESPRQEYSCNVAESSRNNKADPHVETSCACDFDDDSDVANILHKKCPVISLARRQLHRLQTETDKLLCPDTRCCRSFLDVLCIGKDLLTSNSKYKYALLVLLVTSFFWGLLLGAASCGSKAGRFNSPILTCIDNYFILDRYTKIDSTYRSIV